MKRSLAVTTVGLVLLVCLCGDKSAGPPDHTPYELDTLAVRAILDANSITRNVTSVASMATVNGVARITILNLQDSVAGGHISTLPPAAISALDGLRSCRLDGNLITILPSEVRAWSRVSMLNLSRNQLTSLPPEIGDLDSLRILNLRRNQLGSLPTRIGDLKVLTSLNLDSNQLVTLPGEVTGASNVADIAIDYNKICDLSALDTWLSFRVRDPDWKATQDTSACHP
jgi:Leucine-rich repeat (LRR) protein